VDSSLWEVSGVSLLDGDNIESRKVSEVVRNITRMDDMSEGQEDEEDQVYKHASV